MKTLEFKTNIKCSGCEEKVAPALDLLAGQGNWKVDLASTDRILTVTSDTVNAQQVTEALKDKGYTAAPL